MFQSDVWFSRAVCSLCFPLIFVIVVAYVDPLRVLAVFTRTYAPVHAYTCTGLILRASANLGMSHNRGHRQPWFSSYSTHFPNLSSSGSLHYLKGEKNGA